MIIDDQARLIASLASTMRDSMWASDLLSRCKLIEDAVQIIRKEAKSREGGER